jgi:hypothetical protein
MKMDSSGRKTSGIIMKTSMPMLSVETHQNREHDAWME